MPAPTPDPNRSPEEEARRFREMLEQTGKLMDVGEHQNLSELKLPPGVTHVRYPDGTVKRVRFDMR